MLVSLHMHEIIFCLLNNGKEKLCFKRTQSNNKKYDVCLDLQIQSLVEQRLSER